jgi:hypothetical protein
LAASWVLGFLKGHLEATYRYLHEQAPNATIIVIGYPNLFPADPKSTCKVDRASAASALT